MVQGNLEQPPVVLQGRRTQGALALGLGLVFLAFGALLVQTPTGAGAPGWILLVVGFLFAALGLTATIRPARLTIDPSGIALSGALRTKFYGWGEVVNFRIVRLRRSGLIGFDRPGARGSGGIGRDLVTAFSTANVSGPYDAALPGRWQGMTNEELVGLLNRARAQWGGEAALRAPEVKPRRATGQRIDRRVYWIAAGILIAASVGLSFVGGRVGGYVTLLWIWVYARRLHDIGRSGWWQAPVFAIQAIVVFVIIATLHQKAPIAVGVAGLVQLAFTVVLGAIPGERGDNRFGPAPGDLEPGARAEIFS